jgi:2-oxoglutarate ferredoxin oxidoreductase subunit alpha
MKDDYSILIGGAAGQGSRRAALIIAKLFSLFGYQIFIYDEYQSLIRGGHSFSHIRAAKEKVLSHREKIDFLLALDKETVEKHRQDLDKEGVIIYNSDRIELKGNKKRVAVAIDSIAEEFEAKKIMANTALIAGFFKMIGSDWPILKKLFKREFKKAQELNLKIAWKAFQETENLTKVRKLNSKEKTLLTGNQAIALGAAKAGLDLYIAYPMTPATGILHYLAAKEKELQVAVSQLENEIAVINGAIGAAYTGARTMVASSGGGFSLMTEALSLAAQSETAILIVESQRMSPGSGVPTYNGQGDLLFSLTAGHGDILRFVVAPGDAEESFYWAGKLLNLSWQYQTPSILLVDKEVSESTFSFDENILDKVKYEKPLYWNKKDKKYLRYKDTGNGISPLAFPGEKNIVVKANSYEHDEYGLTVEDKEAVKKMQAKRLRKFKAMGKAIEKLDSVNIFGKKNASKAVIAWGSTKGPAKEAAERLGLRMIQPVVLEPFPEKAMKRALKGVEKIALVETNGLGQLGELLARFGIMADKKILKYDARPFLPEEIEKELIHF